ncbi:hypothetical protein NMY22_g14014 [Coprinellus aureogranulatus]|nr:hypothetical protein NMY22_g14014 [Coprinellus aureogranulatus]
MPKVSPISDAARRRAEGADVSKQRWTIENSPEDQMVELAYVFKREHSGDSKMMRSLEYIWGMREGTLNLDTRRNIFFVGKVLHKLYKEGKWVLCPEESILDMFLSKPRPGNFRGSPLFRSGFPNLTCLVQDATYKYTFFPLTEMSDRLLRETRGNQPGPGDMQAHPPPYTTLPAVASHVHPKFALLRFSQRIVLGQRDPYIRQLLNTNRIVQKAALLFPSWNRIMLPLSAATDPTFVAQHPANRRKSHPQHGSQTNGSADDVGDGEVQANISSRSDEYDQEVGSSNVTSESGDEEGDIESDADEVFSDNDSNATPPRRVWYPPPPPIFPPPRPRHKRPATHSNASDIDCRPQEKHRKMNTEETGWTKASITQWARACSSSPPPEAPPSPSAAEAS